MKKIFALLLATAMLLSFAACGDDERPSGTASGPSVDKNTIELVDTAFDTTKKAIDGAKALGYEADVVVSSTTDDVTLSVRASSTIDRIDTDAGKIFAIESEARSGDVREVIQYYVDTENHYAHRAGATYLLVGNDVAGFFEEELKIQVINTSELKPLDTTIVDAANGGHGFVVEYDTTAEGFDISKVIEGWGELFNADQFKDMNLKFTGVSVSGIIDSNGRLTSESFKFTYEYSMQVEVPKTDVDPDNSDVSETTEVVTKTTKNELSIDLKFDFDLTEVEVPDNITVIGSEPGEDGEEPKKPQEISLTDFNKLGSDTTDTDTDDEE